MTYIPKQEELSWMHKKFVNRIKPKPKEKQEPFYNTRAWKDKLRKDYITNNPFCEQCAKMGIIKEGRVIDHIIPISQGGAKRDERNYQTLCDQCHNVKRGRERHGKVQEYQLNHNGEKIPK